MHNPWTNLDNIQFEKLGLPRNALVGTIIVAFILYQLSSAVAHPYLVHANGFMQLAPLVICAGLWWFVLIPQTRLMIDTLPRGYFKGLWDYYLFNSGSLEITNDPEPMPLYIPDRKARSARLSTQRRGK